MKANIWCLLIISALLLTGCVGGRSPETHFYQLAATAEKAEPYSIERNIGTIIVEQIILPDYLRRVQVVSRQSAYQLDVQLLHRWGGMLEENMTRVVAANLEQLLGETSVVPFDHVADQEPATRILLRVLRFDGLPGDRAVLDVLWQLKNEESYSHGHELFERLVSGDSVAELVEAQSLLLEDLSHFIADKLPYLK